MLDRDIVELASVVSELAATSESVGPDAIAGGDVTELASALRQRRRELERRFAAVGERRSMLEERRSGLEESLAGRPRTAAVEPASVDDDTELERLAAELSELERRLDEGIERAAIERDRRVEASRERLERLSASSTRPGGD